MWNLAEISVVENLIEILIQRGRPSNKILFIFYIFNWVLKLDAPHLSVPEEKDIFTKDYHFLLFFLPTPE